MACVGTGDAAHPTAGKGGGGFGGISGPDDPTPRECKGEKARNIGVLPGGIYRAWGTAYNKKMKEHVGSGRMKAWKWAILCAALVGCALVAAALCRAPGERRMTVFAMDTVMEVRFTGGTADTEARVRARLAELEEALSAQEGEVYRLNQAGGGPAGADVLRVLTAGLTYAEQSGGKMDPALGRLTALWDVNGAQPRVPDRKAIAAARERSGAKLVAVAGNEVALSGGVWLDFGGLGKGYAADELRALFEAEGVEHALVSLGGNLLALGGRREGGPYRLGIRDPEGATGEVIGTFALAEGVVSTSGDYERYFEQGGRRYHHILDPETGYPALTDLASVTVVAEEGLYADFLSTYLFILGKEKALETLGDWGAGIVLVDREGNVYAHEIEDLRLTKAGYRLAAE